MYFYFKFEKIKSCISVTLRQRLTEFGLMSHQVKKSLQILNMMSECEMCETPYPNLYNL